MARIFVCSDPALATLIDPVAAALAASGHDVVRGPANAIGVQKEYSATERAQFTDDAEIILVTPRHKVTRALMTGATRLRGICSPVIGVESIDLDAARDLGIIVGHGAVRGNVVGMAESTVMLMLMLLYDVQTNIARIGSGQWRRPGHHAHEMEGKTVGLIGFGRIARQIADRLAAWNVRIITYSPRARPEDLPPDVEKVDLDVLLETSDVVSLLTGLTPETHHMIDGAKLALMKPTAYLVNTGRGAVIDEDALIETLREHRIAGAALDTFTIEPLPTDSPLRDLDNVILTPHCVGHSREGWDEFGPAMMANIKNMLDGTLPPHCKNMEVEPAWRERLRRIEGETR